MSRTSLRILHTGALGLLSVQWIAVWIPARLWGAHHLAFLPVPQALALSALLGFALALSQLTESRDWIGRRLTSWPAGPWVTTCLVTVIMGLIFTQLPVGHRLLGDSGIVAVQIISGAAAQRVDSASLRLFGWLYALGDDGSGPGATDFFGVMSAFFGCIYVASSVALARLCSEDAAGRAFAFLMMIGVAPLLLFFGYPEHYAPATAGLAIVTLTLMMWDGRRPSWLLTGWVAGLATTMAHQLAGFCLLPLGVATVLHIHRSGRLTTRATIALGFGLGIVGSLLAGWAIQAKAALLLPLAPHAPYAIWGPAHLGDALNGLLLMAPLHPVVIAAAVAHAGRRLFGDPVVLCLGAFTCAGAAATAVVDPALGALDWDLMSLFSIPLGGLAALCAGRYLPSSIRLPGLIVITAAILLHLVPWILVNHNPAQAVPMVEAMVRFDPHHDSERRMKLAVKFEHGGFGDAARRQYVAALQADDTNLAALRNLGFLLYLQGDIDNALQLFRRLQELAPADGDSRSARSVLLWHAGEEGAATRLAVAHLLSRPTDQRATDLCRTFSRAATVPADRALASLGVAVAAGDVAAVARTIASLEAGTLDSVLLGDIRQWLRSARTTGATDSSG